MTLGALSYLTGIYLQSVLGLSALQAGLVYVPFSLTSMFFSPIVGRLTDRVVPGLQGQREVVPVGGQRLVRRPGRGGSGR